MLVQLNPPLHVETPKGPGWAHFCIDYGPETHLFWVVFMDADGACWTVPNPEIRMSFNWSLGRRQAEQMDPPGKDNLASPPGAQRFRPTLATTTDS